MSTKQDIHDTAVANGFWDGTEDGLTPEFVLAKLALIHSEVSEVLEAYRKEQGSKAIMEEFADVFIRTYDLIVGMAEHGIIEHTDIEAVVELKAGINKYRAHKHGNLI